MIRPAQVLLLAALGFAGIATAAEPGPAAGSPTATSAESAPRNGAGVDIAESATEQARHAEILRGAGADPRESATEQARHAEILRRSGQTVVAASESTASGFNRAVALTAEGKADEAEVIYRRLIAEFPELPEPHNNLAVLLARRGRLDEARAELETAVAVAPNYAIALENLGDVHARLALSAYRRAAGTQAGPALRTKLRQAEALAGQGLSAPVPVAPLAPAPALRAPGVGRP